MLKSLLIPAFFEGSWAADALIPAQIVHVCELWIFAERYIIVFHADGIRISRLSAPIGVQRTGLAKRGDQRIGAIGGIDRSDRQDIPAE
ncbi:hypothetical protein [Rhizobium leguminosarum]|uniref:hypothetical protein n=1 Tax=Rhizobium leguminosarum TaxID=384 RepID=UPI0012DB0832|nr:hypothetical protein [Rhizobium leguminosarum]